MPPSFRPRFPWKLLVAIVSFYFVLNSVLTFRSTQIMQDTAVRIDNTLQIISVIKELRAQLYAAESGHRGYLITTESEYLEPYHLALDQIQNLLNQLSDSTTELPQQFGRSATLNELVANKIQEMSDIVLLVDQAEKRSALRVVNTDKGLELGRQIMALMAEMEQDEQQLLQDRRFESSQKTFYLAATLLITNILGLVLTGTIFYITLRHHRRTEIMRVALEDANQNLEQKVADRTQEITRYSEELERSNKELEDFAFVASHDLQEPLRKIRAFGDRLLKRYSDELGDHGSDYIRRMHAASERMSLLIDDLLSFSRVTTKQKPFTSVDLNEIIASVKDNLEFAIESTQATVETDNLPVIDADESQIRQVFANLISNSIKFMKDGVPPRIQILASKADDPPDERDWVRIEVIDNGIGFDQQYDEKIFNLFQRLHGRDAYSGTGIGLALCRKIIERHNGSITAMSSEGEGSTFIIYLPVTHEELTSNLI